MRFRLFCLALLLFAGCTPTEVAQLPTLRGPVVPTRILPSVTPTFTPTDTPSPTPSFTPTEPPTLTFTPSPTATFTETATNLPTNTATSTETATDLPTNTQTNTPSPTDTPTSTATATPTSSTAPPTLANTPSPTATATVEPTLPPEEQGVVYTNATWIEPVEIAGTITLETPVVATLDNQNPVALYNFDGTAGAVIDIEMSAQDDDLDTYLQILDPKGREIARNDDISSESGDSAIRGVILPESGTYVIVATRFGQEFGGSFGDFELVVSEGSGERFGTFSRNIGYDALIQDTMDADTDEHLYTFRATAGDVITIQLTNLTGNLDPNVTLTDNLGTTLAYSDDNLLTGTLDSAIQGYIIPRSGFYSIVADHYRAEGESGEYRLKLALDAQNAISRFAVIDTFNSVTVGEENDPYYTTYIVGDWFNDADEERSLQVLLTFHLPPAGERSVEEAIFTLAPCIEYGGGFEALGALTIYSENYGDLVDMRNVQRPQPGASVLSTQSTCAPLNLTELVQDAYASSQEDVQFRIMVRDLTDNGEVDQVQFAPSLLITFRD